MVLFKFDRRVIFNMYIGCNWSKALKFLLEKDAVKVDYIKTGSYGNFNEQFPTMRSIAEF